MGDPGPDSPSSGRAEEPTSHIAKGKKKSSRGDTFDEANIRELLIIKNKRIINGHWKDNFRIDGQEVSNS